MVEVAAHDLGLFAQPSRPDAEEEAAAAEVVERRDFFGEQQRVTLGHEHDAGAELDARGRSRGACQRHEGIHEVGVGLGDHAVGGAGEAALRVHGDERVLGAPERLEAKGLGLGRHRAHVDEIGGQRNRNADVHQNATGSVVSPRRVRLCRC
jgi:hypothetical protein